jgi:hypothetical protein
MRRTPRTLPPPLMALLAGTLILSCGAFQDRDRMPCGTRCRYDYQFCHEGSPSNTGLITFPLYSGKESGDDGPGLTTDYCTEKYRRCLRLCESRPSTNKE